METEESVGILDSFEKKFLELQESKVFFAFEIVFALYILMLLALISDKLLLPALLNISKRYGLS